MVARRWFGVVLATIVLGSFSVAAVSQVGTARKPEKKPGLIQRIFGKKKKPDDRKPVGRRMPMAQGNIVGNKNTKVYHMPGDPGNMPAEKNRVYFRTERAAMAAGYRRARLAGKGKPMGKMPPRRDPKTGRFIKH